MQFLDLSGVKKFKQYVDENFTPVEDHENAEKVAAAALNNLNDRLTNIEDEDWVTAEDYSEIENAHLDVYSKEEIDSMLSNIEGGTGEENVIESITFNGTPATINSNTKTAAITVTIPAAVTESTVANWGFTKNTGTYSKPSTGIPASDLANNVIPYVENFYFVQGSSSQAGNATSGSYLSTKWEGTVPGVSAAIDGLKIAYRIATNTGVSTAGVVLSIDNTNYYPVVIQKNTIVTTHYPVGTTVLMVFNSTQTATAYLTSNTKSTVTGCWQIMEYDSNTNTYQRVYTSSDNVEYPITTRYNITSGSAYYAEYGRYSEGVTLNPSTNTITAESFKIANGNSSQFLKADGSIDSNTYALASSIPAAPGTLKTNATTAQTASSGEAMSGIITLHKVAKTGTYSDLIGTPTIPTKVSDLTNDSGFTSNTGTITGITMNGSSKGTSGVVNLGTVLTAHQDISGKANLSGAAFTGAVTGTSSGNASQFRNITISSSEPTSSQGSNGDIWIVI